METRCEALTALLGADNVLLPGSAEYNASLESYFSPQASAVHPLCFVTPKTTSDVSAVVKSLVSTGLNFAVRGAGHMWIPGASNSPGGVTIDLRGIDSVSLSADRSRVSAGAGATWDLVYGALDPLGLSVAGGRVAGVGVGGLALGGGISYFSPRRGWTCDSAASFEVVLAGGEVVRASDEENADLWRGLRGGGNSFGIVTGVEFVTFEQGPLWSALVISPTSVVEQQAQICARLMAAETFDEDASFLTGWAFSGKAGGSVALHQLVHTRPDGTEIPPVYQDVLNLPTIPGIGSRPIVADMSTHAQNSVALCAPQAARPWPSYLNATTTFIPTEAMIRETYAAFDASLPAIQHLTGIMWALNLEPLPPQIYARAAADNALGLGGRKGSLVICLLSPAWQDASQDEQVYAAARALMDDVEARAKKLGVYDPYVYMNYAAPWQDVIGGYGEESVARLRALRVRVDPDGVFTSRVEGGFKIPSLDSLSTG
ncbi:hypothetical protein VPNG_02332 [Cytospora leucostoma]|uniref:FAD-binding PCMH-type domain-containing protein n=1 Tax=Cytospora leucostoma TaxID=1230097 RepID=A0A423XGX9_9PEZI|nr:hypothetical protein VPNG_02332 [Cytospora leucostoma]